MPKPPLRSALDDQDLCLPECSRVLLVDDEPGNLEVLQSLLEDDWEVDTATSGQEALAFLAREGPTDLIIADQRMPGMTGIQLLAEVARRQPATMRIVLTGYTDVEPMLAAANTGLVYRFLLKPFDPVEIQGIVRDALHMKACAAGLVGLVTTLKLRSDALAADTEQLRQAQEQLLAEERLNTLGHLVTDTAEELQTRSASLSLLLGLIRQTETDVTVLRDAEHVWAGLSELRELLAQVRDYTRTTTSNLVVARFPARALLQHTMERFLMEELGHRCPVTAQIDDNIGYLVADHSRLQQALLALLRNAVRASPGGEPILLAVRQGDDQAVYIEVRDRGHGMTPEMLQRSLQPFYSADPTPGIGLGLEIARLGASAHGGRLELDSHPGEGTTARLVLPASTVEAPHGA